MKKFLAPFFLAIWFTAFSAGCGSGNTTTVGLQVELTGIARTSDGVTKLSWRVVNPNIVPYLVAATRCISMACWLARRTTGSHWRSRRKAR